MLTYRKVDYEKDLEQIVKLLQINLDPDFTSAFFKWKHLENPFGRSVGFVALERDEIVGVRMLMRWKFRNGIKEVNAVRPVDTAVAANHRAKGVFRELIQKSLAAYENDFGLIFNTPNENSLQGNLSMGWKKQEDPGIFKVGMLLPFRKVRSLVNIRPDEIQLPDVRGAFFRTKKSREFLDWRYCQGDYKAVALINDPSTAVIYDTRIIRGLKMIVVYESFGKGEQLARILAALGYELKIFLIYYLKNDDLNDFKPLFSLKRNSPVVVYKQTSASEKNIFSLSLGDLEAKI